jgi:hypothetical protein
MLTAVLLSQTDLNELMKTWFGWPDALKVSVLVSVCRAFIVVEVWPARIVAPAIVSNGIGIGPAVVHRVPTGICIFVSIAALIDNVKVTSAG